MDDSGSIPPKLREYLETGAGIRAARTLGMPIGELAMAMFEVLSGLSKEFRRILIVAEREDVDLKRIVEALKKVKEAQEESRRKSNPRSGWNCDPGVMKSVYSGLTKRSYDWTMRK